jgi:hypothetical protein
MIHILAKDTGSIIHPTMGVAVRNNILLRMLHGPFKLHNIHYYLHMALTFGVVSCNIHALVGLVFIQF